MATTTTIALIGDLEPGLLPALQTVASNVAIMHGPDDRAPSLREAWASAQNRQSVYTMVAFDPLQPVVDGWLESLDTGRPPVELGIPVTVPDYYLVSVALPEPSSSWYLQFLFNEAPARVGTFQPSVPALYTAIDGLAYGPSLPTYERIVAAARSFVPTPGFAASHARSL